MALGQARPPTAPGLHGKPRGPRPPRPRGQRVRAAQSIPEVCCARSPRGALMVRGATLSELVAVITTPVREETKRKSVNMSNLPVVAKLVMARRTGGGHADINELHSLCDPSIY